MAKPYTLARGIDLTNNKVFVGTLKGMRSIIDRYGLLHAVNENTITFNTGITDHCGKEIFVGDILVKASGKDEREYMVLADPDDEEYFFMTLQTWGSIEDNPEPQFEQHELTRRRARFYEIATNIYHKFPEED